MFEIVVHIHFVVAQFRPENQPACRMVNHLTRCLHVCEQMSRYYGGGVNCDARDREQRLIDACRAYRGLGVKTEGK